jgi:hypothetical protein
MKKVYTISIALCLIALTGFGMVLVKSTHAQAVTAATPYSFTVTGTLANCPAVSTIPSGTAGYCFTNTGLVQSVSGAAWGPPGGAASISLTLNGTTKVLPNSFTIAVAAPSVTATAAASAVTAN